MILGSSEASCRGAGASAHFGNSSFLLVGRQSEPNGLPLIVRADRKIALTIETGDEHTGQPGSDTVARSKHAKGPVLQDYVRGERQLSLLDARELPQLWILLVARNKTEILAELSRPTSVSGLDGRVSFADERILLPSTSLTPTTDVSDSDEEISHVEVMVERI